MTRELKLSLILGFSLVLVVTVLIGDHLSKARTASLDSSATVAPVAILPPVSEDLLPRHPSADRTSAVAAVPGRPGSEPSSAQSGVVQPTRFEDPAERHEITVIEQGGSSPSGGSGNRTVTAPDDGRPGNTGVVPAMSADRTHTIAAGDTLYGISRRYYRDGKYHRQLAMYNSMKPEASLRVGAVIRVPEIDVLTGRSARPSSPPRQPLYAVGGPGAGSETADGSGTRLASNAGSRRGALEPLMNVPAGGGSGREQAKPSPGRGNSYTVKKGDTLGHIAARELGSARRASEILDLNSGVVSDEFGLKVGMVIKLPSK